MKINRQQIYQATKKSILFEQPDFIPMRFHINKACWDAYSHDQIYEWMESHPFLFPDFQRPEKEFNPHYPLVAQKDHPFRDDFGCLWKTSTNGITGVVTNHPLNDWADYKKYVFPDPDACTGIGPIDWNQTTAAIHKKSSNGEFTKIGLRHGHTFLQICDIRGYENILIDMEDEEPLLADLLERITQFNLRIIEHCLETGADMISIPEDLGMQQGPMLLPNNFRKYILPCYQRLIAPVKKAERFVHFHSDGDIRTLMPDLMSCGMDVINLQDLVNGISWIREHLTGKICVELDIDRQNITPFGTPQEIDTLIRKEVEALGSRKGGLMMIYGLYPGVPPQNVTALMDAMEKYAFYYS